MRRQLWLTKIAWAMTFVISGPTFLGGMLANVSLAQGSKPTVALVQVVDSSKSGPHGLSDTVRKELLLAFGAEASLSLVADDSVTEVVARVKHGEPASLGELAAMGRELKGVNYVVAAEVVSVSTDEKNGRAELRLAQRWVSGSPEREVVRTLVAGRSSLPAGAKGNGEALLSQAAEAAARISVEEAIRNLEAQGTVLSVLRDPEAPLVSLGTEQGLRSGAELAVLSQGKEIARLRVTKVDRMSSQTKVISRSTTRGIQAGDPVSLVYNPSLTVEPAKAPKKPSAWRNMAKWIVTLGIIWLLTREHKGVQAAALEIIPPTSTALPADGTSTLQIGAKLLDANNRPLAGVKVNFSVAVVAPGSGSAGSIISPVATNASGVATTTLTAGTTPLTVTVTATQGSLPPASVDIHYVAGTAQRILLTATPTSIPANNTDSSQIQATVKDAAGNNVQDGTIVSFATTLGTILPPSSTTAGGVATTRLTSTQDGTALVTATSGTTTSLPVSVTLTPVSTTGPASIVLSAVPNPTILEGGIATADITATLRDAQGNPVGAGITVEFTTTLVGAAITGSDETDASGVATATFNSVTTGVATITATSGAAQNSINVTVSPGAPQTITLAADPASVEANGNNFSTITATIRDASGNLVADGTEVTFSAVVAYSLLVGGTWTSGEDPVLITPSTRTNVGVATAILVSRHATLGTPSLPGTVTVTAIVPRTAPLLPISNSAGLVQFVSQRVSFIAVGADPLNIRGLDWVGHTSAIRADVFDQNHNPVADGTAVYFSSDHGMISGDGPSVGGVATSFTSRGTALATLTSEADGNTDLAFNGLVTIRVTAGGLPGSPSSVSVEAPNLVIFSGPAVAATSSLTLSKTTLRSVGDAMTITITVHDRNDNPVVDDTNVTVSADLGTLDSTTLRTRRGVVQTVLRTSTDALSPTASGPGKVQAVVDSDPVALLLPTDPADGAYTVIP